MITPFRVRLDAEVASDLRERLHRTRWPEPATTPGWEQGTPLADARDLCDYWADGYDWAAASERLNQHPQFVTEIDGLTIHFVHRRSPRPDAIPLIMTHGWPGSVVEFAEVTARSATRRRASPPSTWSAPHCLATVSAANRPPPAGRSIASPTPGPS
jgi:epoxide hydrolase